MGPASGVGLSGGALKDQLTPSLPLQEVGRRMGLETHKLASLWKDRAVIEINVAVLHSFQVCCVLWIQRLSGQKVLWSSHSYHAWFSPDNIVHFFMYHTSTEHLVCARCWGCRQISPPSHTGSSSVNLNASSNRVLLTFQDLSVPELQQKILFPLHFSRTLFLKMPPYFFCVISVFLSAGSLSAVTNRL